MDIHTAQKDVRTVFLGGAVGQAVSGLIWLLSALLATTVSHNAGFYALVLGGMFIYPLTVLGLKLLGQPAGLPKDHPFNALAMQVAFVAPLLIPLVLLATRGNPNWFYPAFLIAVGVHYLPFIFLYGMPQFGVLAAAMLGAGVLIAMYLPENFTLGGWVGAALLLGFAAFVALTVAPKLERTRRTA